MIVIIVIIVIVIILLFLIFNFLYFILSSLSPIPFFPTNKKDVPMIVDTLFVEGRTLDINSTVIDLGAGTGTIIFAAAREAFKRKLNAKFIAIEIHPLLFLIMHLRRLFHPNRQNIKIIRADMFNLNYQQLAIQQFNHITIYIYVGLKFIDRLKKTFLTLPKGTRIISYMYQIPGWEKKHIKTITGHHKIFAYQL